MYLDLVGVSNALVLFILGIVDFIIYGIANVIPPITVLSDLLHHPTIVTLLTYLIAATIMLLWATMLHLLVIMFLERKLYARMQDRYGILHIGLAGFLQTIADGVKLFQKENITPAKADPLTFHAAPVIIAASSLLVFAALPFSEGFYVARLDNGLLFILAAFSVAPFGILMAGWSSNNKYTLIGGMRAAAMLMSYEIPMLLSIIGVVMLAGTLDPILIVQRQEQATFLNGALGMGLPLQNWYFIPQFLGLMIFTVAVVAESERIPFDIPEAEAELVEGWTTEYSGMRFGIVFGFKWLRIFAGSALIALLYFGGWSGPFLPQEIWFLLKIYLLFIVFVFVAWSMPRIRIDQILKIGWNKLIPLALVNLFIAASLKAMGWF